MIVRPRIDVEELIREDSDHFRVNSRIYCDPEIFELEMERIYGRAWVYVAHESEVAQPGDYKTAYIGRQPVIVTRDADDGEVYVLYNRCRHRGATVCQEEYGNASYFRCAYHGWTYRNRGDLVSVPMKEGYGPRFDTSELGLVRVPRVDSYRGFIFASLSADGPSLEEHLGNVRPFLDMVVDEAAAGMELRAGVHKYGYNGNWKLQLENSVDNYHFTLLHKSVLEIRGRRPGATRLDDPDTRFNREGRLLDLGNGHAAYSMDFYGPDHPVAHFAVFPNLILIDVQVRVLRPIAVNRTEVYLYPRLLKGVPESVNAQRLRQHEEFYGSAAFGGPDDVEMFNRLQAGFQATGNEWVLMSRGLDQEAVLDGGVRAARLATEVTQRAIYRRWKPAMAVD